MQTSILFDKLASLEYSDGSCQLPFETTAFELSPVSSDFRAGKYQLNTLAGNFIITRLRPIVSLDNGQCYNLIEPTEGELLQKYIDDLFAYLKQENFI